MSNHGHYYSGPPPQTQSPFYAQHHSAGGPPSQQQQHYATGAATSPVSNYSNSPPQQQPPPLRPHTAAPYSTGGGYAPPSAGGPGGYYQQPPSHQSQAPGPPPPSGQGPYRTQQGGRPDFSPPQQSQQPQRQEYAPPSGGGYSPDLPHIIANTHGLPPDVVQKLAEDLMRSIQFNQPGGGGAGGVAPPSGAPLLSQPVAPHGQRQGSPAVSAPAPPPPQPQPYGHQPRHQQMPSLPGAFPTYGSGPGPTADNAPPAPAPAPAPAPPHHGYHQQRPSQSHYGVPSQQSYFPPQPPPTSATGPPPPHLSPKGPPAAMRDDGLGRKQSHRQPKSNATSGYGITPTTSTSSAASGKQKTTMDDGAIFYELWGDLVDKEPGREPRPREKLINLLRETANYMIKERPVKESIVITPDKMVDFYACNAVEKEPLDWKAFFIGRTSSSLSSIYRALNCEHFYIPPASDQKPCIPALTPRGFETWMFTQLMSDPNREAARFQKIVSSWTIMDTKQARPFPKSIPRRCFPEKEDQIICDGWWRVWEEFPPDFDEESEEETLALPAPGGHHYGPPRDQMTPPEVAEGPFVSGHRKKVPMTAPYPGEDEDDRRHGRKDSKSKAPIRKQYADPAAPPWREEPNPRPILGEEPKGARANPPTRPHTSHGHHPSVDTAEKPRSSRQRDRSEYRHRHQSRHRSRHRRERSPSPEDDWSGSSGSPARTPGSGDGPSLDAPAPGPPGPSSSGEDSRRPKRLEDIDRVQREQQELLRKFEDRRYSAGAATYPDDFEEPRYPRERERERDDRRVAEYAYQDEFERDLRRPSGGGPSANGGGSAPGDTRRSHHGGGSRREGDRFYGR